MTETATLPRPLAPKGERTRASIVDAAASAFCVRGYEATRLEDIGDELGLTRSAILYHFASKADLLVELAQPALRDVDALLDDVATIDGVLSVRRQRLFLRRLVDIIVTHRAAMTILTRDIGCHRHLPADLQISDRVGRFAANVVDRDADPLGAVRAVSALGALGRPLAVDPSILSLTSDAERDTLAECALAALRSRPPK